MFWIRIACIAALAATALGCERQDRTAARSEVPGSVAVPSDLRDPQQVPRSVETGASVTPTDVAPMRLRTWVQVGGGVIPDTGCAWHVRMYAAGADERPVWDSARLGRSGCPPPRVSPTAFGRLDDVRTLLGDSLPPGPYRFAVLLRTDKDSTEVDAGRVFVTADPRPPLRAPSGLTFEVRTAVGRSDPAHIRIAVRAINTSDRRLLLEYGACALHLLVYRNAGRVGPPASRSGTRVDRTGQTPVCPLYLVPMEIGPGETREPDEFRATYPVTNILGDSLPAAKYYLAAQLVLGSDTITLPAGSVVLD